MQVKIADFSDLPEIEEIYKDAREFMKATGNGSQWGNTYPARELLAEDIEGANLYTVRENNEILGVFFFKVGIDPTYLKISGGEWKNDLPYGVIHRIAVSTNAHGKGVSKLVFDFAFDKCHNVKIDTHRDNIPMQSALLKNGFEYCGVINIDSGEERITFQKCK